MASTSQTFLGFTIFFLISLAVQTVAGRNVPTNAMLQPEWLEHFDRSVLIPGIGRVMVPKKDSHVEPFDHYNPITGAPSGHSVSIPGLGGSTGGATGHNYIPGGDDTYLPNPGVEVPNPVGGEISAPTGP